jgi:hypothetical protein
LIAKWENKETRHAGTEDRRILTVAWRVSHSGFKRWWC